MGWIGDEMRKQFSTKKETVKQIDNEVTRAYFENLANPVEHKVNKPTKEQVHNAILHYAKLYLSKFNKPLELDNENLWFVHLLSQYFSKSPEFIHSPNVLNTPSLDKGLLVAGTYGFGKSMFMNCAALASVPGNRFRKKSANEVVIDYETEGPKTLKVYRKGNYYFDDFGTEEKARYFGKEVEVFKIIIEERYNKFITDGFKTHLTTNLTPDEIGQRYGGRIGSRLREKFNIIIVNGKDRRIK